MTPAAAKSIAQLPIHRVRRGTGIDEQRLARQRQRDRQGIGMGVSAIHVPVRTHVKHRVTARRIAEDDITGIGQCSGREGARASLTRLAMRCVGDGGTAYQLTDILLKCLALLGVAIALRNLLVSRRAHLFEVYRDDQALVDHARSPTLAGLREKAKEWLEDRSHYTAELWPAITA